jgi:hypothetical protein
VDEDTQATFNIILFGMYDFLTDTELSSFVTNFFASPVLIGASL